MDKFVVLLLILASFSVLTVAQKSSDQKSFDRGVAVTRALDQEEGRRFVQKELHLKNVDVHALKTCVERKMN